MTFQECLKIIETVEALINLTYQKECKKHKFNLKCKRCVAKKTASLLKIYKQQYIK